MDILRRKRNTKQGYEVDDAPDADLDQGDDYKAILSKEANDAPNVDDVHPKTSIVHFDSDDVNLIQSKSSEEILMFISNGV